MPTLIEELSASLRRVRNQHVLVQNDAFTMLVTTPTKDSRRQAVKVCHFPGGEGGPPVLQMQSRVCIAQRPEILRWCLKANAQARIGGFALETSTDPPVIDVVYTLLADEIDFAEFALAIQELALFADAAENQLTNQDEF